MRHRSRAQALALATIAVATAVAMFGPSLVAQQPPSVPKGDKTRGRKLFTSHACFQCHANEAQGGATGPRLGPNPLPFARFTAYVRAPRGEMPPYTAKVLSEQDLADIYAFLEAQPRPKPLDSIPLLTP